ncbi:glutamate receptor ionotropic, kainate 2-like isoform X4 [Dreissena polymorpha]|uniref:glutamate receptor ionotropic, kainate 2-like isoform X4 n=1 Tax=Dreissena polymorpha TaxID=45954 RepID=UPI002263AC49|nr:glutamate receptor ionotropic, kainate 2-like isoform X4 [Dreissena polymorpha]
MNTSLKMCNSGDFSIGFYRIVAVVLLLISSFGSQAQTETFRIAGLFEPKNEHLVLALQNAATKVNMHQLLGPSRIIVVDMEYLEGDNSFEANKKVCRQMRGGIAAIFGPVSEISRAHVQGLSQAFEIPHLQAAWDARNPREDFSISVYPDHEVLSGAYADLIKYWKWTQFTVIYEDNNSLIRLQKILELARGEEFTMKVRQLQGGTSGYISMLKDMHEKLEYRMVIDCSVEKVLDILDAANSLNMVNDYFHFHFTSLDISQLDLDRFAQKGANITAMRLIRPSSPEVVNIYNEWANRESNTVRSPLLGMRAIATETALMYDAVNLFARALSSLSNQQLQTEELQCGKKETWKKGANLLNYIKSLEYHGLSGKIRFEEGRRKDFNLDVISLTNKGITEIGSWNRKSGVNISVTVQQQEQDDLTRLRNMTLRVVTIFDPPYVIKRNTTGENGRYEEGFIIDLMEELSKSLGFKYEIYEQHKKAYGSEQKDGKWDGMIGDLIERDSVNKADLAAAGLTITYDRARVVDFTMPFLNLGITIIYKKPEKKPPALFSFLSPLSIDVWIYMIAAYLCVSFMLFVIARFTPYEWENPHPCNEDSEVVENQFTILNSLWFTIGSLMQQGSDIAPKAGSSRLVASTWYVFTLVIVSSYTANLAAHLTIRRLEAPIKSAADLSQQTAIKYGTLKAGATRNFFKNSNLTVFKRMNAYMEANADSILVDSNKDGFERVVKSNYAFLAESTSIDYQIQRNCDLMQIGSDLDTKGYGIAAPKGSPWIGLISREIVRFQQQQVIQGIYKKWWVDQAGKVCKTDDDEDAAASAALGVRNVGGVFVVLAGGSIFGLLVSILEFLWKVGKNARKDKQSFWSEFTEELRFVVRCKSSRNLSADCGKSRKDTDAHNGVRYSPANTMPSFDKHRDVLE